MQPLFDYLRQRRRIIGAFACFCGIFLVSFLLYRLPAGAVIYPALLCALLGALFFIKEHRRIRRRHAQLQQFSSALPDALPPVETTEEADYQRIIRQLCEELCQLESRMNARYSEMMDYYTVWAHQIKTPIAAMRLQLQNEDSPLSRALSPELLRIEQYAEMVLAYLRLDADSTDYVFRECDLDGVVRQAVRRFSGEFIARRLRLDYAPLNARIVTDEKWLSFVVEQLLSNALKYTRSGGVSIFLEPPGTLCIRDTGIGIAPEDLPRIFEKGFTGMNGRTDKKASGIGLYLCRRVCKNLGHGLTAESAPGRGTTMRINLAQRRIEPE